MRLLQLNQDPGYFSPCLNDLFDLKETSQRFPVSFDKYVVALAVDAVSPIHLLQTLVLSPVSRTSSCCIHHSNGFTNSLYDTEETVLSKRFGLFSLFTYLLGS